MKKNVLKIVCAVSLLAVATTASAEWRFAGYDTTNPPFYGKIYNEVINGKYTSKQKIDPVAAEDVEWKFEGYELDYPHTGYQRLYLEGNAESGITRTVGVYPQWETRFVDFLWEVCGDHQIYQRQQTKIFNKNWKWDFGRNEYEESLVLVPTQRVADVTVDYKPYGFANLDTEGNFVFDDNGKVYNHEKNELYYDFEVYPEAFHVKRDANGNLTKNIVEGDFFHSDNLSRLDVNNQFAVADWDIAARIDKMESKFVTGPSYAGESGTKDVAGLYYQYAAAGWRGWNWDKDTVTKNRVLYIDKNGNPVTSSVKIGWGAPEFEMVYPYKYYQFLIVDGVIMDGHNDTPRIFRYTGGVATPEVEWRFAFAEAEYPYQAVEFEYIKDKNGKWYCAFANDGSGAPIWRYATVTDMGRTYVKETALDVEVWVHDEAGDYILMKTSRTNGDFGAWYDGYVSGALHLK